jgi:4-hydroxymandelate oxidase
MSPLGRVGQVGRAGQPGRVRLPRREDLVNVLEFEDVAKLTLDPAIFATIAGSDRAAFDRITFRPRMLVPTLDLDLSVQLFGQPHFTPIIVGPVADQRRFHPDAEVATARGAGMARAALIVSSRSSVPIAQIAAQATTPLWCSVYADTEAGARIDAAMAAGCKVACVASEPSRPPNWRRIETLKRGLTAPLVIKGIMTPQDAKTATALGASGVIVSDHGAAAAGRTPIEMLPAIVEACAGTAAVLIDGGFRRGSDIAKALALGAQGVLVARPVIWGLAAYGAEGVRGVLELLQSDLARNMGALGASSLQRLTREMVRVHRR